MLSRVAETIYWMARYVERAENVARLMDVNNHLTIDLPLPQRGQWEPMISIMADEKPFYERHREATEETVVNFMALDPNNPNSIISCLRTAREDARIVREIIPSEMWLQINTLYLMAREVAEIGTEAATMDFLSRVRMGSHLFFGLMNDIMSHNEAFRFAQLGRYIERADKTSRIIDVKYFILLPKVTDIGSPFDSNQWMALLKSVSAYEMYWKKHSMVEPARVVDFLLREETFPRSIRYCLRRAQQALEIVAEGHPDKQALACLRRIEEMREEIDRRAAQEIILQGLHEYVDHLQRNLNELGIGIYDAFFSLKPVETETLATEFSDRLSGMVQRQTQTSA